MTEQNVVITGAHSYLGRRVVQALLADENLIVHAIVTPWAQTDFAHESHARLRTYQADLAQPLTGEIEQVLRTADRVFHFAWVRGRDLAQISSLNNAIISALITHIPVGSRFFLISSAAAAPFALSVYGKAKWLAERHTRQLGGSVLVCGLVIEDEPQGPYRMMCRIVKKWPLAIRMGRREPFVYPVHIDDFVRCVRHLTQVESAPAHFRAFSEAVAFNRFIAILEEKYRRRRFKVTVGASFVLGAASALKRSRIAPFSVCDKVHSLFYKDDEFLRGHTILEGVPFRRLLQH